MENKKTKDELLIEARGELTLTKERLAIALEKDHGVRMEISNAFNLYRLSKSSYDRENLALTWSGIFIELGKLLARQKALQYVEGFEELNLRLKGVEIELEIWRDISPWRRFV